MFACAVVIHHKNQWVMFPIPNDRLRVFTPFLSEIQSLFLHSEAETALTFSQLSALFQQGASIDYLLFGSGLCCNTTDAGKLLQERINQCHFAQNLIAMLTSNAIDATERIIPAAEAHHAQTPADDRNLLAHGR